MDKENKIMQALIAASGHHLGLFIKGEKNVSNIQKMKLLPWRYDVCSKWNMKFSVAKF